MSEPSESARVGVVGLGGMGVNHAERTADYGGEVVAGTDVVDEARESFAAQFGAATYEDHGEMYDAEDLDAVFITTPNKFHESAAVAAFERDLHVLCEKPLANTLDSAERIAEAAAASDGIGMLGFANRFSTTAEVFTDYREEGRFGDLNHIEANYVRRRGIPGIGSWFTSQDLAGGGALIDIGVHAIDLALYLAGYPEVEEVSGVARTTFDAEEYEDPNHWFGKWSTEEEVFDVDDSASAFIRCAGGLTISLEVSWATNRETERAFHVRGTDAGAKIHSMGGDEMTIYDCGNEGVDHFVDSEIRGDIGGSGYELQDAYFLDRVVSGEPPEMNTISEGLTVQRVIDAIYRSSERGGAVEL